jgi:NADP-dependent 3-hydroxy acid dehydrogenase YdfG
MSGRLDGKVAIITGAASGIEEDHKGRARYVRCDVMQEAGIEAAVAWLENMIANPKKWEPPRPNEVLRAFY